MQPHFPPAEGVQARRVGHFLLSINAFKVLAEEPNEVEHHKMSQKHLNYRSHHFQVNWPNDALSGGIFLAFFSFVLSQALGHFENEDCEVAPAHLIECHVEFLKGLFIRSCYFKRLVLHEKGAEEQGSVLHNVALSNEVNSERFS